jgi:hypothetical protein
VTYVTAKTFCMSYTPDVTMSKRNQPDEWLANLLPPRQFAHEPPLPGGTVTQSDA